MSRQVVQGVLSGAVVDTGTFTVTYPTGTTRGDFSLGVSHKLVMRGQVLSNPADIGLSFGATSVTVTNRTGATFTAGSSYYFEFDKVGSSNPIVTSGVESYQPMHLVRLNLGSPAVGAANSIWTSAALTTAAGATAPAGGALVSGGVADLGTTGRNVIAAWTGTAVITITGTDIYGNAMVEKSASGTSLTGAKAFKRVTSIAVSADVTALTVGTGNVLGVPVRLPSAGHILKELEDGATASAGTVVGALALDTKSTATSADIRGTYVPNSTPDASKAFALICALPDPAFVGAPQYAG
jgi:hypothetical protein